MTPPIPIRLSFKPSRRRKDQRLARRAATIPLDPTPPNTSQPTLSISPTSSHRPYDASYHDDNWLAPPSPPSPPVFFAPYADSDRDSIFAEMSQTLIPPLDPNARPACFRNLFEECIFVFTVMMATSATTFVQGVIVINTALIGEDLMMTSAQMTWIAAAIGLTAGSFMLFSGKTADLFGRKSQLICGMALLAASALGTAFVRSAIIMNVLCGFLGLGTATISPPAIGTLFATYPVGIRRNRAAGALGSGNPIGFIMGSISSGLATRFYGWRASFVVIAIFFFVMALLAVWTMPAIQRTGNVRVELKIFDWLGTFMIVMGMSLFCAALTEGPLRGWKAPSVLVMLILGFFLLCSFWVWEHIYRFPLLNPIVWKNRNYTLCVLSVLFGYMSFITNQFWISLYMQEVQKLAPLHIAVRLLPQAVAGVLWSYVGQALVHRVNGTILMGIGGVAYFVGALLQIFIREHTSYWKLLFPALCITVLGADFQFIVSNLYVTKQMGSQSSLGAGVLQTAMRLSVSLGLGITAAVYGSSTSTPQALQDITFAYDRAYLCSILFAAVGVLCVPFMKLGKQGGSDDDETQPTLSPDMQEIQEEERPRTAGEYQDPEHRDQEAQRQTYSSDGVSEGASINEQKSIWSDAVANTSTCATVGSKRRTSFFPRWSWEVEKAWKEERQKNFGDGFVIYEVCINCLNHKRKVVGTYGRISPEVDPYEPTPIRGGDIGCLEARSYDVPLGTLPASSRDARVSFSPQVKGRSWF